MDRQMMIERVASIMEYEHPKTIQAACLYWAATLIDELSVNGIRGILQAGTLMWPRIRPEQDDGVSPTHFSYVWEANSSTTRTRIAQGLMPEMHVWVGIPETQEIVDLTTRYLKGQCQQLIGHEWIGDDPPHHLWCKCEELPPGVIYRPDRLATMIAWRLLFK